MKPRKFESKKSMGVRLPESTNNIIPSSPTDNPPKLGRSCRRGNQEPEALGVKFIKNPINLSQIAHQTWSPEIETCIYWR